MNRDRRRKRRGDIRTYEMDLKERIRKHNQANNRGRGRVDPYEPGEGDTRFAIRRENTRRRDCIENGGWACGWRAMDWDPTIHGGWDYDELHNRHYRRGRVVYDPYYDDLVYDPDWYDEYYDDYFD